MSYMRLAGTTHVSLFTPVASAQRNDARKRWGETGIAMPGRTDIKYPKVPGAVAAKIVRYWNAEVGRLKNKYITGTPSSAAKDKFNRDADKLYGLHLALLLFEDSDSYIPDKNAADMWSLTSAIAIHLDGTKDTPARWSVAADSVAEAAKEAFKGGKNFLNNLPTIMYLGLGVLGLHYLVKLKGK